MSRIMTVTIPNRVRNRSVFGSRNSSRSASIRGTICRQGTGRVGILVGGTISAVVVTVTVDVAGVTPSVSVTGLGEGVHVDNVNEEGSVHVSVTGELNPPIGVTVTVILTGVPMVPVAVAGAVTVKLVTASFVAKASDAPFRLVWKAGGEAVAVGKTGKVDAVEKVCPVTYTFAGFDESVASAKIRSGMVALPLPPK